MFQKSVDNMKISPKKLEFLIKHELNMNSYVFGA